jgi:predicted metal-dependent peptidase
MKLVKVEPEPEYPELKKRLEKAHVTLMRHRLTAPYIGAMMLGTSEITTKVTVGRFGPLAVSIDLPSACTDGINKKYNPVFLENMNDRQLRGIVMHENLHVMKKDIHRHVDLFQENPGLANAAVDFTVNDIIEQIREADPNFIELPPNGCYHSKFRNWTAREIYHYFKTGQDNQGNQEGKPKQGGKQPGKGKGKGKGQPGEGQGNTQPGDGGRTITIGGQEFKLEPLDKHDFEEIAQMSPEQVRKEMDKVNNAIHQGGLLAGRLGMEMPRSITEAAEPEVDWREVLREFVTTHTRGRDEYTYRKYNRHRVADDLYIPNTESEKVGEVIVAIDTSGSIGEKEISEFAAELVSICGIANPERVRVLWWDTVVHGEQIFTENEYAGIAGLLKPLGGGGTHVGCVSKYIVEEKLDSDCVIIFTDGYVEGQIDWRVTQPTLWMVTVNADFHPPGDGKMVKYRSMKEE